MSFSDVQQADANLWLAYAVKLKNALSQSPSLGFNARFYVAPISAAGIAAGSKIPTNIMNNGVYNVGDALLDHDDPVFLPAEHSYFQHCQSYCNSVKLESDNPSAAVRYQDAQEKAKEALKYFTKTKKAAMSAYNSETSSGLTTDQFDFWVMQNYPQLAQAQNAFASATANCAAAAATMSGPNAAVVGRYMSSLSNADSLSNIPGYNMTCSSPAADQIASGNSGSFLRPTYIVESKYASTVDDWVSSFVQNESNPTEITFNASDASNSSWDELGYDDDVEVTGSYCTLFSATFDDNGETVTKVVSAEEAGDDLEITVTATSLDTFQIQPGQWNPAKLAGMPLVSDADEDLKDPKAKVTSAILAYGVGMQVELSSSAYDTINNYLEQAQESGGSASIFGFNIGLGDSDNLNQTSTVTFDDVKNASSGTTITIPASNNSYPTLLAVVGESIPEPNN